LPALAEIAERYPGRLTVIEGDALSVDIRPRLGGGPVRIVANLPYNVATPLLTGWLTTEPWPPWWHSMTLMFQREVAERIVAAHGSKTYGRLSILSQWRTEPRILFDVSPQAFVPPPNVTSSVVHFLPRAAPYPCRTVDLERLTAAAFGQRRKMLRSSLKALGRDVEALCAAAGVASTERAEDVPVEGFARMAAALGGVPAQPI
jgi:16S rRNA (adenine1518-N6/adenine1519-N6)-dimethyltransferase